MKKLLFLCLLFTSCCRDPQVFKISYKEYEAPRVVVLTSKYDTMRINVPEKHIIGGKNYQGIFRIRYVTKDVYDSIQFGDTIHAQIYIK